MCYERSDPGRILYRLQVQAGNPKMMISLLDL